MVESSEELNFLYNSQICRLCGEENPNGYFLYTYEDENDLRTLINTYLPLKISDDGKYPRWICPGCHLQVESTVQFFNLVIAGQQTLQQLYEMQSEKQDSQLEIKKEEYIINVYPSEHEMLKKMSMDSSPPKRKRGRPRKTELSYQQVITHEEEIPNQEFPDDLDVSANGRKKRRIKVPLRYQGVVRGKELEKIYVEKGIIDRNDADSFQELDYDDNEDMKSSSFIYPEEVIGHVQDNDGVNLGDLVIVKNRQKTDCKYGTWKKMTKFMCDICKICFYYEHKFLQHRSSHQNVQFECNECLQTFVDRGSLIDHQNETEHQGEGIIEAFEITKPQCNNETTTDVDITSFMQNNEEENIHSKDGLRGKIEIEEAAKVLHDLHKKDGKITHSNVNANSTKFEINSENQNCDHIEEMNEFLKEEDVDQPSEVTTDCDNSTTVNNEEYKIQYICEKCKQPFENEKHLLIHNERDHSDNRRFICSKCGKPFRNKLLLQRHQTVHSDARPFSCDYCGSKYKTKQNLLNHTVTHTGEKKYECNICKQHFAYKTSLSLHLRWHKGDKPFRCTECGKSFTQFGNMQEHLRIHTGERPFECEICGKKFKTSSQRRMHVKRHQIDRPIKCTMCDKSFVNTEEHKIHLRRHYNIKPFVCNVCSKSFIELCALKKHLRLHTGEKPYTCHECGRGFADRSNLKKHLKMHECKRKTLLDRSTLQKTKHNNESSNLIQLAISSLDNKSLGTTDSNSASLLDNTVWNLIEETNIDDNESTSRSTAAINNATIPQTDQLICVTYQNPNDGNKTTLYVVNNASNVGVNTLKVTNGLKDTLENSRISDISNDNTNSHMSVFLNNDDQLDDMATNDLLKIAPSNVNQLDDDIFHTRNNHQEIELVTDDNHKVNLINYPD